MSHTIRITAVCLLAALAGCKMLGADVNGGKQSLDAIDPADAGSLAVNILEPKSPSPIKVASPAFEPNGEIPYKYSDYGEKSSPELTIGNLPPGTVTLALLLEDPDAPVKPFVHWILFNVPPDRTHLREAMPGEMRLRDLGDANQGLNTRGSVGYFGMRPPYADPAHHYHFQVFALDTKLNAAPGADRPTVLAAMKDHVLASGEVVGTFKAAK